MCCRQRGLKFDGCDEAEAWRSHGANKEGTSTNEIGTHHSIPIDPFLVLLVTAFELS
jgi:hypothetical protein